MALHTNPDREVSILQRHLQILTSPMTSSYSQSITGTQKMLLGNEREASIVGLKINVAKTQYIMVGNWSDHSQADCVLQIAAGTITLVDDFRYLGSWIMDSKKDFLAWKALAWDTALNRVRFRSPQ